MERSTGIGMNGRIEKLLQFYIKDKEHHKYRQEKTGNPFFLAEEFAKAGLSDVERSVKRLAWVLEREKPVVFPDASIVMMRTVPEIPEIFTEKEWEEIKKEHAVHEQGKVCNVNPDYMKIIGVGFDAKRIEIEKIMAEKKESGEEEAFCYLEAVLRTMDLIETFAERYAKEAERAGNQEAAAILRKIPKQKAESLKEALQFFRLLHYCLWCSFNYHNTIGRFDQYMEPFLKADLEKGILTEESALELLEEFFISFNVDSDLYPGMQQGDNGQSMVLGGSNAEGEDLYNPLSDLCMQASLELRLIDPKINLRVHKNTPLSLYERGTELTKQGLGFPQYSNDDVVVQALLNWGYEEKDAWQYVVAACWEFIIPGCGMDIPNIDGLSFADAVVKCLPKLTECSTFADFLELVKCRIGEMIKEMTENHRKIYMEPSPVLSLLMDGCVEKGKDISAGNKYNNYGIHGTGLSTAVDSLAAIRQYIYEEKSLSAKELLCALEQNFKGQEKLRNRLRFEGPKMGNDDDRADDLAVLLLDWFADGLSGIHNDRGGIYRAGTGSAMYYIWHSKNLQATPDGRDKGEELACNYSPSLFSRCLGPVSIIKSFAKPHLVRVANGGPLTIELYDSMFRNKESIRKVAMFVKSFMDMGGHQMQINAVNRENLLDAKAHPENHRNLIVRVWGWSGYFVELDEVYQNQIIKRMELTMD